jgi:DNA-binding NarL/FixJ family response regulator
MGMEHPVAPEIKVLLIDDNPDLTDVLARLLATESDLSHVGTLQQAGAMGDAFDQFQPDVALVDLTMSGKPPLEAMREATQRNSPVRMIAFSGYDDIAIIDQALDAGATGFVSKHCAPDIILEAIRRVARGETVIECP